MVNGSECAAGRQYNDETISFSAISRSNQVEPLPRRLKQEKITTTWATDLVGDIEALSE